MRKIHARLIGVVLLLALVAVTISLAQQDEGTQPVFRIGVLDDERGPIAQGAALAVRQINQAGGVLGADGTRFRLELVIASTPEGDDLTDAIQFIDDAEVIAVLGPRTTESVLSNLPQLQDLGVPVLTPALGDTITATDPTGRIFRIRAPERLLGAALASYLVEERNISRITTVQLDRSSTSGRVGFSVALSSQSPAPEETTLLLEGELADLIADIVEANPSVIVTYSEPGLAANFYNGIYEAGWRGVFAYPNVTEPDFTERVPLERLQGVIGVTTWPTTAVDEDSTQFILDYVRVFGEAPDPINAAAFDAVNVLATAIGEAGTLEENLVNLRSLNGIQGTLNPPGLMANELSDTVAVIDINTLGGPEPLARYAALERLPDEAPAQIGGTPQPSPTPTPDGVVITIESARQNIRTGPGTNYDVLGQLQQGEQRQIIGANIDFSWVVIEYRGQNGWLYAPIAEIFGDREEVPVITPPPTPTPPPATATPSPPPIPDIIIVSASPSNITLGQPTTINVTVRNAGGGAAGPFAIAATFPPDNLYSSANLNGLAAGTDAVVQLPVTLNAATGNFNVTIVADLNNTVNEGAAGEANNTNFTFNYKVDRQLILINSTTLNVGTQLDMESNVTPVYDLTYTASGLNTTAACAGGTNCVGVISPALTWDTAHYDAITAANGVNASSVPNAALTPGTTLGILTAEGRRGVIRVDAINPGVSITMTYRLYSQPPTP